MNLNKWIRGFQTIYESIWVGINKDVLKFMEDDSFYKAKMKNGTLYYLQKKDIQKIEELVNNKGVECIFGVEKQLGTCTEILMEFQYKKQFYRVVVSYGIEGKKEIFLCAWGEETFPNFNELAKGVCTILLEREKIKEEYRKGLLKFDYEGLVNKNNCSF